VLSPPVSNRGETLYGAAVLGPNALGERLRFQPPTREYAGYIFDFDGTLVDSMPLHFKAWRHALISEGATFDFDWPLFLSRAGMPLDRTVVELNAQFGTELDPFAVVQAQAAYHVAHLDDLEPIDEVVEFARECARRSPLGIASGGGETSIRGVLSRLGLLPLFSCVITPADVIRGKPAPDSFLLCAERLGLAPAECLVVEDGEMGFVAARAAGMDYVAVAPSRNPF
jgi:HAD superfamily hydrolase (TIGR01509 family)